MSGAKKVLFLILLLPSVMASGQGAPFNPVSGRIFTQYVFNPAIAGSRDFLSVDLLASLQDKQHSQLLGAHMRIGKKEHGSRPESGIREFSNIGAGAYIWNDNTGSGRNAGAALAGAYHIPLGRERHSFLSLGAAAKGFFSHSPGDADLNIAARDTVFPDLDAGIYFYNPVFHIGLSATNIFSRNPVNGTDGTYEKYVLNTGFKILISRSLRIILEPLMIAGMGDALPDKIRDVFHPGMKLYLGNFCMGSYLNDYERIPFFFQYKYPGFYIGTFFDLPRNTPFYKKDITAEIALGINIIKNKTAYNRIDQW
ncbi:MAG TPA: type IX secretion system membrane protein PorP/SprF [Bacteroidales bacterium]|jgi:type IX secretion system PorP/SprF family membrane protein|nr:type IX secretion system membrane protein PorP/SprF [Bacteroidales bacterium]HOS71224.1 type IX secretion system membrane protein PorP/SprF [Bacteroidales bacterium]HQH24306.1 type IX secretion system membrane protein PorP/SprF [Bacteroidales bacterium]HQJ81541.1 type IX secretion system membrane protein PorP/SprF [Bacteroidales bacterium]